MRTIGFYLAGAMCAVMTVGGQALPDAAKLLAAQGDLMKNSSTVQYTQQMDMEMTMMGMPITTSTKTFMQYAGPEKFRMESGDGGAGSTLMIYDGKAMWMYMPAQKEYSRMDMGGAQDSLMSQLTSSLAPANLPDAAALARNARVLRSEAIEIDGQVHDCWVVEVKMDKIDVPAMAGTKMTDNVSTYWLDKQLGIAQRTVISGKMEGIPGAGAMETRSTMTLHDIKINGVIPASAFEFTPPEGAKESSNYFATLTNRITGTSTEIGSAKAKTARTKSNYTPQAFVPDLHPTTKVEAKYPPAAKAAKVNGMVQVLATLDPAGSVVETEALSGEELLQAAAVDAVKQWRFRPVLRDGKAVYAYTAVYIDVVDPELQNDQNVFLATSETGEDAGFERVFELMRTMPRTPQEELADMEQDLGSETGMQRTVRLPQMAKAALSAGSLDKASEFANEMLKADSKDFMYGQLIFDGRTTLGLVALRQGNVALASQDLLESAQTPGSPMMNVAGPDFTLARELLAKGEKATVLEFLERCKKFWTKGTESLDAWIGTIRGGGVPDFRPQMKF